MNPLMLVFMNPAFWQKLWLEAMLPVPMEPRRFMQPVKDLKR